MTHLEGKTWGTVLGLIFFGACIVLPFLFN